MNSVLDVPDMAAHGISCDEALNRYLDHLLLRGRAQTTVRTYATSIGRFYAFLTERSRDPHLLPIDTVQPSDIAAFLLQATRAGRKPSTRAAYLTALTAFFRYLILQGLYPGSVERLRMQLGELTVKSAHQRPAPDQRLPALVHAAERAVESAATPRARLVACRNRAILHTLFASGMRVSEVSGLSRQDLDWARSQALITGKGGRQRLVFFSPEAVETINRYLDLRGDDGFSPSFCTTITHIWPSLHANASPRARVSSCVYLHARSRASSACWPAAKVSVPLRIPSGILSPPNC